MKTTICSSSTNNVTSESRDHCSLQPWRRRTRLKVECLRVGVLKVNDNGKLMVDDQICRGRLKVNDEGLKV